MTRRARGYALGVAVAVLLLVAVAAYASYRLVEVYTSGYRSLSEYVSSVEKPVFDVAGVDVNGSNVVVTLINKGPHGTHVDTIYLYKYVSSNIPTSVDTQSINKYVPVGGKVSISIPEDRLLDYMVYNQPLRLSVGTSSGIILLGLHPFKSTVVVNVNVPKTVHVTTGPIVNINCPASATNAFQLIYSKKLYLGNGLVKDDNGNYHGEATVIGFGSCKVTLILGGKWFSLKNPWQLNSWEKVAGKVESRHILMTAFTVIKPGSTSTVDFTLPEFQTKVGGPPTPPRQVNPSVIDFSWLYYPNTQNGEAEPSENTGYWSNGNGPVGAIEKIIASGAVTAYSPAGCPVYPPADPYGNQTVPSDVEKALVRFTFLFSTKSYAEVTGVPVLAWGYPDDCRDPSEDTVLVASVKFQLSGGRYLLIPVVGYDDDDGSDNFNSNISLSIQPLEGTGVSLGSYSGEAPSGRGPVQITAPTVIDVPGSGGYYFLRARVTGHGSAKAVAVVFSKVIVVPLGSSRVACTYVAPSLPTFPWASVDVASGSLQRNAKIIFAYAAKDDNSDSLKDRLAIFSNTDNPVDRVISVSPSGVSLSGSVLPENLKEVYVADGYSMSIRVNPNGMESPIYSSFIAYWGPDKVSRTFAPENSNAGYASTDIRGTFYLLYHQGPNVPSSVPYIDININTPGGDHYAIIPVAYGVNNHINDLPRVEVTSGYVLVPSSGNWELPDYYGGKDVIIVKFSGNTEIKLYLPTDKTYGYPYIVVGGIYVVQAPDNPVVPDGKYGVPVGIVLEKLKVISSLGDNAYATLVDTLDGSIIGTWTIDKTLTNVTLGIGGMAYSPPYLWLDNMKYFDEYRHWMLVIYNTLCAGTNTGEVVIPPPSSGNGNGNGGGSGGGGSTGPGNLTVTITAKYSGRVLWVPVAIDSQYSDFWSSVSDDGSDIYVTTPSGNPVYYGVYIDKKDEYGVVWIYVHEDMTSGDVKEYIIHYGGDNPYSNHRRNDLWSWREVIHLNEWDTEGHTLMTTVDYESIYGSHIDVRTRRAFFLRSDTVYSVYTSLVGVKGFYMDITEVGHDTDYKIDFTLVNGTSYTLYLSTCNETGNEYELYKGNTLLYSKDVSCTGTLNGGVGMSGLNSTLSNVIYYAIDEPIKYINILPTGGDVGESSLYVYLYYNRAFGSYNGGYRVPDSVTVSVSS